MGLPCRANRYGNELSRRTVENNAIYDAGPTGSLGAAPPGGLRDYS